MSINNTQKGIIYLVLSSLSFAIMNTFIKFSGDLPSFQKSFIRTLIILFCSSLYVLKDKADFFPKKNIMPLMIFRCFVGFIGLISNYYTVEHMILSDATMLQKMSPFFTIIFSFLIMKEDINLSQILCILLSFFAAGLIIKPSFTMPRDELLPALTGILGAVSSGLAYSLIRLLSKKNISNASIVFNFAFFSTIFNLPLVLFNFYPMTSYEIFMMLLVGIFAFLAQIFLTTAYSLAASKEISIFDYSQLFFATIIAFFLFDEYPSRLSILGYFLIILAASILYLKNKKIA